MQYIYYIKYNISIKVIILKKELHCKPFYNKISLKTKIKLYGDEAADIHARKILESGSNYIFWLLILTDSVLKKDKNYYLQLFWKNGKPLKKKESD